MSEDKENTSGVYRAVTVAVIIVMAGVICAAAIAFIELFRASTTPAAILPSDTPTSIAHPTPGSQLEITSTPDNANWAITYEYVFPAGTWSNGDHQYTLETSCPSASDPMMRSGEWTNSFRVSASAPQVTDNVYLRTSGLFDDPDKGNAVSEINSSQPTVAVVVFSGIASSEAQQYSTDCEVTVKLDNGSTYPLVPGAPFQP